MTSIAISNIAWDPADDAEVAGVLALLGVSAVEVAPTKYWPAPCRPSDAEIARCATFWHSRQVAISSFQSLLFGRPDLKVFGDQLQQDALVAYLQDVFCLGHKLGATPMVFGSPGNRARGELDAARACQQAIPLFRRLGDVAQRQRVLLCIEPNPPQYGCDFLTDARSVVQFVAAVEHPCVRAHLDAGIMAINGEPIADTIDACLPWLAHFHASEPQLAPLGSGGVDHAAIGRHLRQAGYQGTVAIEMRMGANPADRLPMIQRAIKIVQDAYAA
jgi:D-psicose/D-tagatose/L-ribulose 3-epimerase